MRIAVWLVVSILLLCLLVVPKSTYADDEILGWAWPTIASRWPDDVAGRTEKEFDVLTCFPVAEILVVNSLGELQSTGIGAGRWPDQVAGRIPTKFDIPPQLTPTQAFRWSQASPASRVHLAKIYGVPPEIAKMYWANYKIP